MKGVYEDHADRTVAGLYSDRETGDQGFKFSQLFVEAQ